MPCTIIAECGVNHDGDLGKALRLCDAAKHAGADIAKFQIFQPETIKDETARRRLTPLSMATANYQMIARHCKNIGIEFCATPDSLYDLDICLKCDVKRIKLGSGSLLYRPLVDAAFDTGLPVLLSTGMATFNEVERVIQRQFSRMQWKVMPPHLTVMHCVSLYPCPPHLANVAAITQFDEARAWMWRHDSYDVGYSDHTIGVTAPCAAVTLGATVIEKHFTLDQRDEGPDHHMSADPADFRRMVVWIRDTETVLGHGDKKPSDEELAMIPRVRKDTEGFQPGL